MTAGSIGHPGPLPVIAASGRRGFAVSPDPAPAGNGCFPPTRPTSAQNGAGAPLSYRGSVRTGDRHEEGEVIR